MDELIKPRLRRESLHLVSTLGHYRFIVAAKRQHACWPAEVEIRRLRSRFAVQSHYHVNHPSTEWTC